MQARNKHVICWYNSPLRSYTSTVNVLMLLNIYVCIYTCVVVHNPVLNAFLPGTTSTISIQCLVLNVFTVVLAKTNCIKSLDSHLRNWHCQQ